DWIEAGAVGVSTATARAKAVNFTNDVEPIFRKSCFGCHSGTQPKSQLRLDAAAGILRGGTGGAVIAPGKSSESRLVARIEGKGGEQRMPLKGAPLPPAEIAVIRSWIDAGAELPKALSQTAPVIEKHWAYIKPVRPTVPQVKGQSSLRNPIDAFVLAKLEAKGLSFSPPATRETLIRRLSLDLIGLPPKPDEVTAFLNDSRPDAVERLVDRLLASPHYGERWARHWLDMARYADTHGFEKDDRRTVWKFRDWVIDAFNRDMPYDQFTIEQIAGDMLPNATESQKIATGFHRNTMFNEEGGVDKDEAYFEVLVDRVNTTTTVWLGSTVGCAQCHNHKYDPLTHKEYYQMMAFFGKNSKKVEPNGTGFKYREPTLDLATADQASQRERIRKRIEEVEQTLKTHTPELAREQQRWEEGLLKARRDWAVLKPSKMRTEAGTVLTADQDSVIAATGENPQRETYTLEAPVNVRTLTGLRLETFPDPSLPTGGPGRDVYGHFGLTEVQVEVDNVPVRFKRIVADDGRVLAKGTKQLWTIDASREETRLPRQLVLAPETPISIAKNAVIRVRLVQNSDLSGQTIGKFRLSLTSVSDPVLIVKLRPGLRTVLETQAERRTAKDATELATFFRTVSPSLEPLRDELRERKNELEKLGIVTAMVMEESPDFERPFDFVRTRGAFASKADKVYADVPAVMGGLPPSEMPNRLGLARWLASKDNPLTARVAVNRIWEHYFGRGIVETTEDFGTQGERPSHPELLDWLAVEFMDQGWSLKALHKLIVLSNAYQQTSNVTPALLQTDPYNRLISRGARFRMEAEMVRDTGLAASGLLSAKVGGPSVFPPQPPGVWDIPYNDDKWEESRGEDKYRRGIYTFIRRTALYPAMMNFDAGSREACTVRRTRTNSPLAALTTLNDQAFFEMARALGERIVSEGGEDDSSRIRHAFRLVTARAPKPGELDRLLTWLSKEKAYFNANTSEAASVGVRHELAPWTMLANVLLNLDEALTKE
ncbi:MAG TPA: PSD1 and planctomycete cytochrome C domain-containing protein, partial [Bryobacteraceae bacterium]|nr:PSD1 and planctomycete cytochrome C domain-containing protein [Bryobacteraceae bacterium]